jgi:hypothetical protein
MADLAWNVALPPNLILKGGYTISVQAIDPSTGNFVSGLQVQDFALEVDLLGALGDEKIPPVLLLQKGFQ